MFAQRQVVLLRQVEEMRERAWIAVNVVVRIQMRWRMANHLLKTPELFFQSFSKPLTQGNVRVFQLVPQVHVQAHTQRRGGAAESSGFFAPGGVDQQAGAGQDATQVRFQDAAVDATAGPE